MADMTVNQIGSEILLLVENIPSTMSGTPMQGIIYNQVRYIETYTGQTLGSTAIPDRYHYALVNLSVSEILMYMQITGVDASSISIGDFSISKGAGGNLSDAAQLFRERGIEQLRFIGWSSPFYQAL